MNEVKILFLTILLVSIISACNGNEKEVISGDFILSGNEISLENEFETNRVISSMDAVTVVDSLYKKEKKDSKSQTDFIIRSKIDTNKSIEGNSFKLCTEFTAEARYQNGNSGPEILIKGDGVLVSNVKGKSYPVDIEAYYGNISGNNMFYFNDPINPSDWYYLESNMVDNIVSSTEEFKSALKEYLYSSTIYESEYAGKECYQVVLNLNEDEYYDLFALLFEYGDTKEYLDAWSYGYNRIMGFPVSRVIREFAFETSIYVKKSDFSLVALTLQTDGVDISMVLDESEHDSFAIPSVIDADAINYLHDEKRDGWINYISNQVLIAGYTPSYYYDENKRQIRLMDEKDKEMCKLKVPLGYTVFSYSGSDGRKWFLIEGEDLNEFEIAEIGPSNIGHPYMEVAKNYYGNKTMNHFYLYSFARYQYGNETVRVTKIEDDINGGFYYEIFFPYRNISTAGEQEYVKVTLYNYPDYDADSEELQELVFSILE